MNTIFEFFSFVAGIGVLFFLIIGLFCMTCLFYDLVYRPLRDKWLVHWRVLKLDIKLWWAGEPWIKRALKRRIK